MDLTTSYLGFELPHPIVPGASPLSFDADSVKQLEDAGAPMIVMHSLFEEELTGESVATSLAVDQPKNQFAEALSYLPEPDSFTIGPDEYLDRINRLKQAVRIPVMASLNGTTRGGWLRYAQQIEEAGADGLELNIYQVATEVNLTARELELESVEMVKELAATISIPVAVKLSPFYTALPNLAAHLVDNGAEGLVLFNRFYQPEIDVDELELKRDLRLSKPEELNLRLRWLAVLHGRVKESTSFACTGGIHSAVDAIKAVMVGAHTCQVVSCLLERGPDYLATLVREMSDWLEEHEYESLAQARGSMSMVKSPNPHALVRANYLHLLRSWQSSTQ